MGDLDFVLDIPGDEDASRIPRFAPYLKADLSALLDGYPERFGHVAARRKLFRRALGAIAMVEGPVYEDVAFRRLAEALGARLTAPLLRAFQEAVPDAVRVSEGDRTVLWPGGTIPREAIPFRAGADGDLRAWEDVPLAELAGLAASIEGLGVRATQRAMAKVLGRDQLRPSLVARLEQAVAAARAVVPA